MRQVRYSVAMSLDGYITGPRGEIDWIVMDPDIDFAELFRSYDTMLIGRCSWNATRSNGGGPAMPGMTVHVFSTTLTPDDAPGAVLSDDPEATIGRLKQEPGKDLWLFGGGLLFRSLLERGLVDAVQVAVIPVLLGGGTPMLPCGGSSVGLRLTSHRLYPKTGTVLLDYEVVRA